MTSSPFLIFKAFSEIYNASVPLPTAIPYLDLYLDKKSFSNFLSSDPKKILPFNKT